MVDIDRPTSPHLQIYRPQLTSVLSISHRISGIFLVLGVVCLSGWIISLALGEVWFGWFDAARSSLLGQVCSFAWVFSLFYHLLNGVRHLCWDIGWGFDLPKVYGSGYAAVIVAGVLTGLLFIFV